MEQIENATPENQPGNLDPVLMEQLNTLDVEQGLVEAHKEPESEMEDQPQPGAVAPIELSEEEAQFTAVMGLGTIEGALKMLVHSDFHFSPEAKAQALEKFAPLLIKYGMVLPEFLMRYKQEIEGAQAAVRLINDGWKTTKALKQRDAEKARELAQQKAANDEAEAQKDAA